MVLPEALPKPEEATRLKDLDELQKLLKLCRKQGVLEIKFGEIHVKFGELPKKSGADKEDDGDPVTPGALSELTPDQMLFYSAGGLPPNEDN